jgi:predicted  nucleic acid-binding Zn-ribbon protein
VRENDKKLTFYLKIEEELSELQLKRSKILEQLEDLNVKIETKKKKLSSIADPKVLRVLRAYRTAQMTQPQPDQGDKKEGDSQA